MHNTGLGDTLRTAARYVRRFRGKPFVVKLGGDVLAEPATLRAVVEQLALLESFSIPLVIVHGGGPQLDALCARLGLEVRKERGRRITDESVLLAAKYEFGALQVDLLAALRAAGLSPVGLSGIDAGLVEARRRPPADGTDFGAVGDVRAVDVTLLRQLLHAGHVPVVAPLTANSGGEIFNTNADTLAAEIAAALQAEKLIFLMRAPGLLADPAQPATLVPAADIALLERFEKENRLAGGMLPKSAAIRVALAGGVPAVHLVSGFLPDALLVEIFTNEGSGSMVTAAPAGARAGAAA